MLSFSKHLTEGVQGGQEARVGEVLTSAYGSKWNWGQSIYSENHCSKVSTNNSLNYSFVLQNVFFAPILNNLFSWFVI